MNFRESISDARNCVAKDVNFNGKGTHFVVTVENGFKVFTAETCELHLEQYTPFSSLAAAMLEDTQITGLVTQSEDGSNSARRLVLWDAASRKDAASIQARAPILRCCLSSTHIAIVFKSSVNLYRHQPKIERIASFETSNNSHGLCCLGKAYLIFPGRTAGHLQIVTLHKLEVNIIPAHASALRAITVGPNEEVVASASFNGTIIRLHSVSTCARMGELRRGVNPASIYSLSISPSGSHLAVTSNTNTLHIFNLPGSRRARRPSSNLDGNWQRVEHTPSPPPPGNQLNKLKWGGLAKVPFAPRLFSDVYSFASANFDPGREVESAAMPSAVSRYRKGIVKWVDDQMLVIINAGKDARYERFELVQDDTGKTACVRVGWSRFLRPN